MQKSIHTKAYKILIAELVSARKAAGLTQEELAKRLNEKQPFIAKCESGQRRIDLIEFLRMAKAVKIDADSVIKAIRKLL
jgi:ribosome-binding protein aMBF1 (putative translation factor)